MKTIFLATVASLFLTFGICQVEAGNPFTGRPVAPKAAKPSPAPVIRQTHVPPQKTNRQPSPPPTFTGTHRLGVNTREIAPPKAKEIQPAVRLTIRQPTVFVPRPTTRPNIVVQSPAPVRVHINRESRAPGVGHIGNLVVPGTAISMDRVPVTLTENLTATEASLQAEADLLREAYVTMSKASHVYHGHRWLAMIQTSRAGAILGIRLCGDGRGHNTREISDQMLREALAILQRVHPMLVAKNKPAAAQHVQNAINQLNIALAQP